MDLNRIWDGILELGRFYNVDPLVFAVIYLSGAPFFYLFLAWLIRNLRLKKSPALPGALLGLVFLSSYLYVLVMGRNVPWWVYLAMAALIAIGLVSLARKVRARAARGGGGPPV